MMEPTQPRVLWLVSLCCAAVHGLFTIVPTTQYVWVDTTATFECATNNTQGYELAFSIPNVAEDTSADTLPGGGQKLTATFTATSDINGTSVTCRAVDGDFNLIDSTEVVQVLVQAPSSVHNLIAVQQECGILISWGAPYLLPGLSVSYKVYIDGEMIQGGISVTNHTYYPNVTSSTVYSISVVAYNESVGDGPSVDTVADFNIATGVCNTMTHKLSPSNWMNQFTMPSRGICISSATVNVTSCSKTNGVCYTASTGHNNVNVGTTTDAIVVESDMILPEDELFDTCVMIDSDTQMIVSDNVATSTYDLRNISVANISTISANTSRLCLQFTLVDGATTDTVHIALESDTRPTEIMDYRSNNELVFTGCIDIAANTWRLSGCDGPLDNHVVCPNPAITTVVEIPYGTASPVAISTSIDSISSATSTSVPTSEPTTEPTSLQDTGAPIRIIISVVVGVVMMGVIIAVILGIITITICCYKKPFKTLPQYDAPHSATPFINKHGDVAFDSHGPTVVAVTQSSSSPRSMARPSDQSDKPTTTTSIPPIDENVHDETHFQYDYATTSQQDTDGNKMAPAQQQYEDVTLKSEPHPHQNKVVYADMNELTFSSQAVSRVSEEDKTIYSDTRPMFPKSLRDKTVDDTPTQQELTSILVPRLSSKWHAFGIGLGITADRLEEIRENRFNRADDCLKDVLVMWEDTASRPYSWTTILEVLRSRKINEAAFANLLEQNLSVCAL